MSVLSRSNWNLDQALVFEERGKPEYPEKNLWVQGKEPTTNSTCIWRRHCDLNPGHIGCRWVLLPPRHPWSPVGLRRNRRKIRTFIDWPMWEGPRRLWNKLGPITYVKDQPPSSACLAVDLVKISTDWTEHSLDQCSNCTDVLITHTPQFIASWWKWNVIHYLK